MGLREESGRQGNTEKEVSFLKGEGWALLLLGVDLAVNPYPPTHPGVYGEVCQSRNFKTKNLVPFSMSYSFGTLDNLLKNGKTSETPKEKTKFYRAGCARVRGEVPRAATPP